MTPLNEEHVRQLLFKEVFNREIRDDELDHVVPMFVDEARLDEFTEWLNTHRWYPLSNQTFTRRRGTYVAHWCALPWWKALWHTVRLRWF